MLIFLFLQTNITVQMRPSGGYGGTGTKGTLKLLLTAENDLLHHLCYYCSQLLHYENYRTSLSWSDSSILLVTDYQKNPTNTKCP